ncbi:ABC transporter ATP-binding protein [Schumannella luteola]|uniref:ABC-type multidrug transport system ATPase subunit n=1 Tax=Schumannella luteola TaxID=472059 RepID=A0A852YJR2_9MICO|nr:ABC transporter ATP-binding protein [Schumannella luteola]NYG99388.1 ABC-type multidrug transport system ATPase subunit [Schumannella luteola]TPX06113.1 ABC transporter ATP-binding protein [Schumannella luteola]
MTTGATAGASEAGSSAASAAATAEPGIVVDRVARRFGAVQAVVDASMVAPMGQVTGLIGPNGSGKTTLMLMLASLLAPDQGSIRVAGHDPVADPASARRLLGWMPDQLGSWGSLSARTTLVQTGRLYGMDRLAAAHRAAELIHLVDLGELADRPSRVLSRGQKQRLSLARALVHDPAVLLLDEPASGLDPAARVALRRTMRRLAGEGRAVLVSSHVLAELDEMADSAVYLDRGVTADAARIAATRISERAWRIRSTDRSRLRDALFRAGVPWERIDADAGGLLVPIAGEDAAAALLTRLVGGGLAISAFAPAVGELEHTFLDLSGERAAGAPTPPITTNPSPYGTSAPPPAQQPASAQPPPSPYPPHPAPPQPGSPQ